MTQEGSLDRGRDAFARHDWPAAFDGLSAVDVRDDLGVDDLERLAIASHMVGRATEATLAWERANREAVRLGLTARAARHAIHLVIGFGQRGEMAQAGAWHARATRMLDDAGLDVVERGYLLIPEALARLEGGDSAGAFEVFERAAAIASRFADLDLATLGRLGRGQSLIAQGEIPRGVTFLDEAMIAVTTGEVSPIFAGIVYCAAIEAFGEIFDLGRAQEWTSALSRWCDAQQGLVPFRGRCLVYRTELMQFHGLWADADIEAQRACEWLSKPPVEPAIGEALYRRAELRRLRGEGVTAEEDYREASQWGRRPEPGLALLRLAQGDVAAAAASIRRAIDEADDLTRARLLEPGVEIMLAAGDTDEARVAADTLSAIADRSGAALLMAMATRAQGYVRLAMDDPRGALTVLRQAWTAWHELDALYDSARVRVAIGRACRALGDDGTAILEFEAAQRVFIQLGAAPDLAGVDALLGRAIAERPGGLSLREVEILRLVANGKTNRSIGAELGISERTVDRHVSNIFAKLDVSSRASATAYAYEHDLA
jgi:DNA-binding CsgD family transcriptional regulator